MITTTYLAYIGHPSSICASAILSHLSLLDHHLTRKEEDAPAMSFPQRPIWCAMKISNWPPKLWKQHVSRWTSTLPWHGVRGRSEAMVCCSWLHRTPYGMDTKECMHGSVFLVRHIGTYQKLVAVTIIHYCIIIHDCLYHRCHCHVWTLLLPSIARLSPAEPSFENDITSFFWGTWRPTRERIFSIFVSDLTLSTCYASTRPCTWG